MDIRERIQKELQCLHGVALVSAGRAANMACFDFGRQRRGLEHKDPTNRISGYALHVQCGWRFIGPEGIIVGSKDIYYPAGDPFKKPDDFNWDVAGANRFDERIKQFFKNNKTLRIVENIEADSTGGVRIYMQGNFRLEIFPDDSADSEHWRFLESGTRKPHFVVKGHGIED
jgi:hypothetical protein